MDVFEEWKKLTDAQKKKVEDLIDKHIEIEEKIYQVGTANKQDTDPKGLPLYGCLPAWSESDGISSISCTLCNPDREFFYPETATNTDKFYFPIEHILEYHTDLLE